jgi:hypothetical protein
MNSTGRISRWEWIWIIPLSLVLSVLFSAALALAVSKLL